MTSLKRLLDQEKLFGTFVKVPSTEIIEIIAWSGFDFIVIDMEHAPITLEQLKVMACVAQGQGLKVVVRPWNSSRETLLHILDLGVDGLQIPQISNKEQAEEIIKGSKYPPLGERGIAFSQRASKFGLTPSDEYIKQANEETLIGIHIETKEALSNISELVKVNGIDLLFLGPVDLSYSLDVETDFIKGGLHKPFIKIKQEVDRAGKQMGIIVNSEEKLKFCITHGINYLIWGSDVGLFKQSLFGVREIIKKYF